MNFNEIVLDEDNEYREEFFLAVQNGSEENIKKLLKRDRMLVLERNDRLQTPLHIAIENKKIKVIPLLLKHFASVDTKDISGQSAMDMAIALGDKDLVYLL